ncbi:MAG: response regulator receiver modulated diguanylate cyclase [Betaproteobacteria bacterium]|nr:response regulator receiver modulated diguanylate cyclase [Betaproteobacteria bacterium]
MISDADILKAKILIVDDQALGARALAEMLVEAGYTQVSGITDPFQVCPLHRANQYKLILLDLQMPGMNGFDVMKELNAIEADDYVPVLAITSEPAFKVHALRAGAKDFISKPFDVEEVLMRIRNMLEIRLLHDDVRNAATTLEILAQQDPLTGLANRRLLTKRISASMANARRNRSAMALVYLDLDGFKQINDNLGHAAGDDLLTQVARRLESVVREEDTVARVGGDEFMIALWHVANANDVAVVASKVVEVISECYRIGERDVTVTASVGVGVYPTDGEDSDALVDSADKALYAAKRAGKNAFRISGQGETPLHARATST